MIRSNVVNELDGGISSVTASIIDMLWCTGEHNMHTAGVHVKLNQGDFAHITAALGIIIADEAALHLMYMCKGSSGLKPCMLCANVFNRNDERDVLEHDRTGIAQYHTCSDFSKLVMHTNSTIKSLIERLENGSRTLTKGAFKELQVKMGWNYVPGSLVLQPHLLDICDPVRVVLYDWMHVFFVNGVFNHHVGLLMSALRSHDVKYAMLDDYINEWTWPQQFRGADGVMNPKRARSSSEAVSFKAGASESLAAMPVLTCFFDIVYSKTANQDVRDHAMCFLGMIRIIEDIMKSARYAVDCDALERSISVYLGAYKALYGEANMQPKMHYMMHFPAFIRRWQFLPNCFVLERKHKIPKKYANPLLNTQTNWETFVLRDVTNEHLTTLESTIVFDDGIGLISPYPASKNLNATLQRELNVGPDVVFMTSKQARMNEWDKCSKGDVVLLHDGRVGEVVLHAAFVSDDAWTCFTSLRTWEAVSTERRYKTWRASRTPLLCLLSDVKCALTWAHAGANMRTLRPLC